MRLHSGSRPARGAWLSRPGPAGSNPPRVPCSGTPPAGGTSTVVLSQSLLSAAPPSESMWACIIKSKPVGSGLVALSSVSVVSGTIPRWAWAPAGFDALLHAPARPVPRTKGLANSLHVGLSSRSISKQQRNRSYRSQHLVTLLATNSLSRLSSAARPRSTLAVAAAERTTVAPNQADPSSSATSVRLPRPLQQQAATRHPFPQPDPRGRARPPWCGARPRASASRTRRGEIRWDNTWRS